MIGAEPDRDRSTDGEDGPLHQRLEAEEAAAAYWRSIAADRRVEAARIQHRPVVRAAIALDRRTQALQDRLLAAARRGRSAGRRLSARTAPGLGPAPSVSGDRGDEGGPSSTSASPTAGPSIIAVGPRTAAPAGATVVDRRDVDEAIAAATAEIVVLLAPATTPVDDGWTEPLVRALRRPDVVAAVPCSLFPSEPRSAHAGQVRSAGARVALVDDAPVSVPLPAEAAEAAVDLAVGGALAFRRDAALAAGGLGPIDDPSAALIDLGLRLSARSGTIVAVRGSRVVEADRPRSRLDLHQRPAADTSAWSSIVDAHGPSLRRIARRSGHPVADADGWSVTVTTATPSRKIAAHSGDWHYAGLLVDALERAGIDAIRQPIAEARSAPGRSRDVHVVVRGLEPVERTSGQAHVLWVISHPEALTVAECDAADLVLVASARFAAHLRTLTTTPVEVFEQATEPRRFTPDAAGSDRTPLTVVANTRGVRRASVDAAIEAGHRPRIHGLGWEGLVDPSLLAGTYATFDRVPAVYASSDLVLNDHWETMRLWGFVSNRILDAAACGALVISDHLPEIGERFGDAVPTWRTPAELGALLDRFADDPDERRERAAAARALVLGAHTFDHRVVELDDLLRRHDLHPVPTSAPPAAPPAVDLPGSGT